MSATERAGDPVAEQAAEPVPKPVPEPVPEPVPVRITDPADPRLADYTGLTDVALRSRTEPERGLYLAESEKVIRRALAAGHRPRSLLLAEKWLGPLAALVEEVAAAGAPVFTGDAPVIEAVTGFHVHRGAIAAVHRPPLRPVADVAAAARRVVVLEDVVDHTNVAAVVRSAAGIGADAVLVTPRCADPLYRRAVRVSMGTVFQVPWTRLAEWPEGAAQLHDAGFEIAALALADGAVDLGTYASHPPDRIALLLGTEGDGLSGPALASADTVVTIPMSRGVDSLNVAAASAVALWALRADAG